MGGVWEKWEWRDGWVDGGAALLFEACCQCGMPKIGGADNSQA